MHTVKNNDNNDGVVIWGHGSPTCININMPFVELLKRCNEKLKRADARVLPS